MSTTATVRDLEYEYLGLSYQVEELLQKKTASYSVQHDLEQLHQRASELAHKIAQAEDPRDDEYEYIANAYKIQELLEEKTRAYSMAFEFNEMQTKMEELARKLGWARQGARGGESPFITDRLSRLQSEIQELRATLK
jgi:seryl-tRNA synthetase